jgi:type III secretion protein J
MNIKGLLKKNLFLPLLLLILTLTACGQENLYQDLTERDANEMLVVLYQHGVDASKIRDQKAQDVSYRIAVSKEKVQESQKILVDNNLPRRTQLGFSGICKEKGLIPTPEEEKCRKLLALKGEIINSLERVPGVIEADVVLNIPEVSEFNTESQVGKKPTASAVLKVRKDDAGYEVTEARMQRFISNSVENLDPRDVSVIISYVIPPQKVLEGGPAAVVAAQGEVPAGVKLASIAGLSLEEDSVQKFKIYAIGMLVILIGVSAALIVNVFKLTRLRQELKVSRGHNTASEISSGGSTPLLEGAGKMGESHLRSGEKAANPPQ